MHLSRFFILILLLSLFQSPLIEGATVNGRIVSKVLPDPGDFVVYLKPLSPTPVIPSAGGASGISNPQRSSKTYRMDQKGMTFIPHILPIPVGSRIIFGNSDDEMHIVHSTSEAEKFNFSVLPKKESPPKAFNRVGEIQILCDIHQQMLAYILVLETPYFSTSDQGGNFRIDQVPPGKYRLATWHEKYVSREKIIDVKRRTSRLSVELLY
ncbi:MAG: hypothetical protein HY391_05310 [Deltaproteobacteria bacterium]|nr:hypothetical protein [Deltaproteobacteria bacterium]